MSNYPDLLQSQAAAHADPSPVGPGPVPDDTVRQMPAGATLAANAIREATDELGPPADETLRDLDDAEPLESELRLDAREHSPHERDPHDRAPREQAPHALAPRELATLDDDPIERVPHDLALHELAPREHDPHELAPEQQPPHEHDPHVHDSNEPIPCDESEPLIGTDGSSSDGNEELGPCPVTYDELIDGLFGALTWFSRAYETICERGEMELFTPHEYVLLRMIARFAANMRAAGPTELAKALGTSKGYVADLSRALVAEGLVVKRRNRADSRVRALDLTPRGEEIASTHSLGLSFWELLNAELGADAAYELAWALTLLRRQPVFY